MFWKKPQPYPTDEPAPPDRREEADDDQEDAREGGADDVGSTLSLHHLLTAACQHSGTDLHLSTGSPPQIRVRDELHPLKTAPLGPLDTKRLAYTVLTEAQVHSFERDLQLCVSFGVRDLSRFRLTLTMQRGAVEAVFRVIPFQVRPIQELGFSKGSAEAIEALALLESGLVLVAGTASSGRTTTLAAMVDHRNRVRHGSILTVEAPLEYLFPHRNSLVAQVEVGPDAPSFDRALLFGQRQDCDLVMISDLSAPGALRRALELVEAGRLVFAGGSGRSLPEVVSAFRQPDLDDRLAECVVGIVLLHHRQAQRSADVINSADDLRATCRGHRTRSTS